MPLQHQLESLQHTKGGGGTRLLGCRAGIERHHVWVGLVGYVYGLDMLPWVSQACAYELSRLSSVCAQIRLGECRDSAEFVHISQSRDCTDSAQ